ncbi:MAG TPA: SulP family inorganic anion transporter [Rickettsiales bacterium]|nr:SulP family inorganic anion transporter [Rickettsiales bacterium]
MLFEPKILGTMKNYSRSQLISDVMAGLIVAIIALPLSIAFGIASGVSPNQSLITAIIAGFIVAGLGGSKVQIAGPTGAFVILVYGVVTQYGLSGLMTVTVMAGFILILFGLFKIGDLIKFISLPLVIGFTAGIAVLIFSTQVRDLLGLTITGSIPAEFIEKWHVYFTNLNTTNFYALAISLLTILTIVFLPKLYSKIPSPFVALVLTTCLVKFLHLPVETIGDRFGQITFSMPQFVLPDFSLPTLKMLFVPAVTIALLGAIESLLSAVVADSMINDKHNSNTELIAQGIANVITPLFGGIPATGAIARTATNIKNGGKTPVSGIFHSVFLLLILIAFAPLISFIPMATLAGILTTVAYNMSGWRAIRKLLKAPKADIFVLFLTMFLTIVFDLTIAIGTGLVVLSFNFMNKMNNCSKIKCTSAKCKNNEERSIIDNIELPEDVLIYEPHGAFFFAVSSKFEAEFKSHIESYKYAVIRMKHIYTIDASGLMILEDIMKHLKSCGVEVLLLQIPNGIKQELVQFGINKMVDENKIFDDVEKVIEYLENNKKKKEA